MEKKTEEIPAQGSHAALTVNAQPRAVRSGGRRGGPGRGPVLSPETVHVSSPCAEDLI